LRGVVVCADDYGLAPGVCDAIEQLIAAGRLSATSAMAGMPDWRPRAAGLRQLVASHPADVGLHLTLTDQAPCASLPHLAPAGRLPPLGLLLRDAELRRLPAAELRREIDAQLDAFEDAWGAPPDYLDGHQHVHVLPGIREAVLAALAHRYPADSVWVRNCCETPARILARGTGIAKALLIATLAWRFARQLRARGIPCNDSFAGLHDFSGTPPFAELMRRFLAHAGARPLVHAHPGHVDAELIARDELTEPRERELAYLASPTFAADLATAGLFPCRFRDFTAG
jgi:chitin disaccharide deacetylase